MSRAERDLEAMHVRLTLVSEIHRGLYHALYSSAEVMRSIGAPLASAAIEEQFARVIRHNEREASGHRAWAVISDNWEEPIGLAALLRNGGRAEFGMMLLPKAWRSGVSKGVIAALLPQAFGVMGLLHVDVSRPDDDYVYVLDKMFDPFDFERRSGLRPGEIGWTLSKQRWLQTAGSASAAR